MNFSRKFLFIFLFFIVFPLFGQEILSNLNTSWTNVLSGVVISEPAVTSYGFCVVTDAKTISAYSNSGYLLWEKSVGRSKNAVLKSLPDDFIVFFDTETKNLKLLNPTGTEIWEKKLDYSLNNEPFAGRDGRFFLYGNGVLECYGINGVCKWRMNTSEQKDLPLQELPDGSIVLFLKETDGQTKGLRISPYGQQLEEITFAGKITGAESFANGILLTFADGSAGLFSLNQDGLSENQWVIQKKSVNGRFFVSDNKSDFLFLEFLNDGVVINEINPSSGEIVHSIKIKEIKGAAIEKVEYNSSGLLMVDHKSAAFYSKNGKELWFSKMPVQNSKNPRNYLFYTKDNHLIFSYKNWTLNAYKVIQKSEKKESSTEKKHYDFKVENNFNAQYIPQFSNELTNDSIRIQLETGFYGPKEVELLQNVLSICSAYSNYLSTSDFGIKIEKSLFERDTAGFEKILQQLMLFGNDNTQNLAASILSKTKNNSFQKVILLGIKNNGYDPDGSLLNALEKIAESISYKDKTAVNCICDAVYSICVFMGRPAYNSKGKEILKKFMYPSYDAKNREYARNTLKKIMALDL